MPHTSLKSSFQEWRILSTVFSFFPVLKKITSRLMPLLFLLTIRFPQIPAASLPAVLCTLPLRKIFRHVVFRSPPSKGVFRKSPPFGITPRFLLSFLVIKCHEDASFPGEASNPLFLLRWPRRPCFPPIFIRVTVLVSSFDVVFRPSRGSPGLTLFFKVGEVFPPPFS